MIPSSVSATDIRRHVAGILRAEQGLINARMDTVMPGLKIARIESHFSRNQDVASFPLIQIEQTGQSSRWEAMPDLVRREFRLNIWGYIHWDLSGPTHDILGEMAMGVEEALLARHTPTLIEGTNVQMYYDNVTPIETVTYGQANLSGILVRGFVGTFRCHVLQPAPDRIRRI